MAPGRPTSTFFRSSRGAEAHRVSVHHVLKHLRETHVGTARDEQTTAIGHVTVADMNRLQTHCPAIGAPHVFMSRTVPVFGLNFQ